MTFACYVVRHGDAGTRGAVADATRPLSRKGWAQAEAIADALAGEGITRLVTSPFTRCVETLLPLSARLGLDLDTRDELAEGAGAAGALAIVDAADAPIVICSHGDVVGALIDALDDRGVPRDDDRLAKGSTWVLTRAAGGVTGAHYVPPPRIGPS
jgi:8-oxo-dGTP diphosphatase